MDERDRLLLTLLRRNARQPVVALARELNLSRSATQERLAKLEGSGAIRGYTIIEGAGQGANQSAYLTVRFEPGRRCAEVVPRLKSIPFIGMIHSLTGPLDLIVRVDGQSVLDIERCRSAVAAVPGIAEVSTSVVLERYLG